MKKIYKYLLLAISFLLIIGSVYGVPNVDSLTVTGIGTENATITGVLNETANATLYIGYNSALTSLVSQPYNDFAETHIFVFGGLRGNTMYFYQMNGSNETTGDYHSTVGNFTTRDYLFTGSGRLILNLLVASLITILMLVLLVISVKMISSTKNFNVTDKILGVGTALLSLICLSVVLMRLVSNMLGL